MAAAARTSAGWVWATAAQAPAVAWPPRIRAPVLPAPGPCPAVPRPLPRTQLLPDLMTDGFSRARLRVYLSHAPLTEAVAVRSQAGLTGSGRHRYSYGGFGGGHLHLHVIRHYAPG
jgi:hypothetical protein